MWRKGYIGRSQWLQLLPDQKTATGNQRLAMDGVEETGQALVTLMHTEKAVIVVHIAGKTAQEAIEIVRA